MADLYGTRYPSAISEVNAPDRVRKGRIMLVGLGNIGSFLAILLAPRAGFIRLVDRGQVECRNMENQFYGPDSVGLAKVVVMADRLERLAPHLVVEHCEADLEDLPWGYFADIDIVFAGLDSLRARQILSERLHPLDIPHIDGAVGDPMQIRVQVLIPGAACLQCSWGAAQYRQLMTEYPCSPGLPVAAPRTMAPACCGAVTAGMMAAQWVRLAGAAPPQESYEIHGDLLTGRFLTARRRINDRCRYCAGRRPAMVPVIPLSKPFAMATMADILGAAESAFGAQAVQYEFRRGILPDNIFGSQRYAAREQLDPLRNRRLIEFGLTRTDRIVIHADDQPHAAHITLDSPDRITT